jgi:glutamine amidotransferase
MAQSKGDSEGLMHGHGWGVADYPDGVPVMEKQTWAAFHGERFAKKAARVYARTVVAHVRRATVGPPHIDNTHPFTLGRHIFAHNGTVHNFDRVRPRLLEATDSIHRNDIKGETDSEHIFMYLMTLLSRDPDADPLDTVWHGLRRIVLWSREVDPERPVGLNIVLTDGADLIVSRLNRSLWLLERDGPYICEICGRSHVHHVPGTQYRSIEVASEPVTPQERWRPLPNGSVFRIKPSLVLEMHPKPIADESPPAS